MNFSNLQTTLLCYSEVDIWGIAPANDGYIYFTTMENGLWRVSDHIPNSKPELLVSLDKETTEYAGIVWDGNTLLYICDKKGDKISSYNIHTKELNEVINSIYRPEGITIDKNGDLFVTDHTYIQKIIGKERKIELIAGTETGYQTYQDGPTHEAMFFYPAAIAIGKDETIYVADTCNYCIRKIKDGEVSTIAGTPERSGYGDGIPGKFGMIFSMFMDENDNIVVVDQDELRQIDLNTGKVTSFHLQGISELLCAVQDSRGTVFVGSNNAIFRLENRWQWERFLWIGFLKEEASYCHLARLPRELVRVIASF